MPDVDWLPVGEIRLAIRSRFPAVLQEPNWLGG
jgi:hypothetical protein